VVIIQHFTAAAAAAAAAADRAAAAAVASVCFSAAGVAAVVAAAGARTCTGLIAATSAAAPFTSLNQDIVVPATARCASAWCHLLLLQLCQLLFELEKCLSAARQDQAGGRRDDLGKNGRVTRSVWRP
jgi:hypothetical protein